MREVEAICLPDSLYDLLLKISKSVDEPKDPDRLWKVAGGNKKEENRREVQSFIGLTCYYRNFTRNYSAIASQLTFNS